MTDQKPNSKQRPTKTFPLREPIKSMEGEEIHEIALRRPKAKNLRVLDEVQGDVAGTLELVSRLSGVPTSSIDEIDLEDLAPIMEWVQGFLPDGEGAGKTS